MTAERFASHAWSAAEAYLAEALAQRAEDTPMSTVQAAYYAMFHAARAVLLQVNGTAPKKHASVVEQFGFLAKDRGGALRTAGRDLAKAQRRRIKAAYEVTAQISVDDAKDTARIAEAFLAICAREFGFPRGKVPDDG